MRERTRVSPAGILITAAFVLAVAVALIRPEAPGEQLDTFAVTDYRSGGYAAFRALLDREGVTTAPFERRPGELDAGVDTLIVAFPPKGAPVARTPAERAALDAWVHRGGRAVILGAPVDAPQPAARGGGGRLVGAFAADVSALAGLDARRYRNSARARVLLGDDGGAIAVARTRGAGEVDNVTQPQLFDNALLAHADNARLAYLLARPRRAGGLVAFDEALHGTIVDRTWWGILAAPERVAAVGIAFALALALIGGALRLGPAVPLEPPREPTSAEFIDAWAALYARARAETGPVPGPVPGPVQR